MPLNAWFAVMFFLIEMRANGPDKRIRTDIRIQTRWYFSSRPCNHVFDTLQHRWYEHVNEWIVKMNESQLICREVIIRDFSKLTVIAIGIWILNLSLLFNHWFTKVSFTYNKVCLGKLKSFPRDLKFLNCWKLTWYFNTFLDPESILALAYMYVMYIYIYTTRPQHLVTH